MIDMLWLSTEDDRSIDRYKRHFDIDMDYNTVRHKQQYNFIIKFIMHSDSLILILCKQPVYNIFMNSFSNIILYRF